MKVQTLRKDCEMFKIEFSSDVEVNCPYREGEKDKYHVTVRYESDPDVKRMEATDFTNFLNEYAELESGITGENIVQSLYENIIEEYDVKTLEVYLLTPYSEDEDKPKVRLYVTASNKKDCDCGKN